MAALVIPLAWATLALAMLGRGFTRREAVLGGYALTCLYLVVVTYALSAMKAIRAEWVTLAWVSLLAVLYLTARGDVGNGLRSLRERTRSGWSRAAVALVGFVGVLGLIAAAEALLYPITNYDSLTYHMPRVFFWYQNQSVAHFPTPEPRQLFSAPLVEYIALHLKVLAAGSDRLVNLAQFPSYLLSVMAASMIAARLGCRRHGQMIAALIAAISPMALLQASTTQTDLTAALWCLSAVYAMLAYIGSPSEGRDRAFVWAGWVGLSIALAAAAKPTSYVVIAPFVLWLAVVVFRREPLRRAVTAMLLAVGCLLLVSGPWFIQNARALDGDVLGLGAPGNAHTIVRDRSPDALAVNAIKNSAMQLGTPSEGLNAAIADAISGVVISLGGDMQNPGTQEDAAETFLLGKRVSNHDVAPAPVSVALLLVSFAVLAMSWPRVTARARTYLACSAVSWALLTGLVTWNQFITRVELPPLLLFAPLVGLALDLDAVSKRRTLQVLRASGYTLTALAMVWVLVVGLFSTTNRMISAEALGLQIGARDLGWWECSYEDLVFDGPLPQWKAAFRDVSEVIDHADAKEVGLDVRVGNFALYPLLTLLSDHDVSYVGEGCLRFAQPVDPHPGVIVCIWPQDEHDAQGVSAHDVLLGPLWVDGAELLVFEADEASAGDNAAAQPDSTVGEGDVEHGHEGVDVPGESEVVDHAEADAGDLEGE